MANPRFQISFCTPVYPAQPQLKHANDWAGMIKPNGPVDFCAGPASPRVRSHCRFRYRGTEYVSKSGMKWMSGSTKRQCNRACPSLSPLSVASHASQLLPTQRIGLTRSIWLSRSPPRSNPTGVARAAHRSGWRSLTAAAAPPDIPMGYDMNGQGAIVRGEATCANGDVTFGCGSKGGGVCADGSKCKPAGGRGR